MGATEQTTPKGAWHVVGLTRAQRDSAKEMVKFCTFCLQHKCVNIRSDVHTYRLMMRNFLRTLLCMTLTGAQH